MNTLREWAATCFYLGKFPVASGTAGSLGSVAIYLVASIWLRRQDLCYFAAGAAVVFAVIGISIGRWAQEYYKQRDPHEFVLDEAAGQMVSVIALTPLALAVAPWKLALAGFLFFRLFDVLKLFPAGRSELLPGGWGIVADDLVAGVQAAICVHLWFTYV